MFLEEWKQDLKCSTERAVQECAAENQQSQCDAAEDAHVDLLKALAVTAVCLTTVGQEGIGEVFSKVWST